MEPLKKYRFASRDDYGFITYEDGYIAREADARITQLETALTACVKAMRKVRPCEEFNRTPWLGICMCVECGHYRSLKSALSAAAPLVEGR